MANNVKLNSTTDNLLINRRIKFKGFSGTKGVVSFNGNTMYLNGSISISNGNLDANGKIKMLSQTTDADTSSTVVTKGYLSSKLSSLGGGSNLPTPPVCTGKMFLQWDGSN
jgi:hypothetical protein